MQSDWPLVRLGDHVDACLGKMLDAKKNKGVLQPYLGNVNVRWGAFDLTDLAEMRFEAQEEARYSLRPGDLVVCEGGEPGRCAIWTGSAPSMKIQKALHRIRPKYSLHNYYLYYWFRNAANVGLLEPHFTGTTIKHLTGKAIAALQVPLPSLAIQRSIVEVLRPLDDRIDLLRQNSATLESIAQGLFKRWFIEFGPVREKADGRQPDGIEADAASLFPSTFEGSSIGQIPAGWRVGKLGDICGNPRGQAKPGDIPVDTPYIGLEHMPRKCIALESAGTSDGLASGKFWFERDDVLFGKLRPYFHKVGLAPFRGVCSTDILVLRPTEPKWLGFVAMHASSDELIAYTTQLSNGARMPRTSWHDVSAFKVAIPSDDIAHAFNDLVSPLFQRIYANISTAKLLAELRDDLLPRLISGKLRLPECQEELREMIA
jgi:type I restriction enzyme S subunit